MMTVSADCRFKPRPAARMLSRKMNASEFGLLNLCIAFSLQQQGFCLIADNTLQQRVRSASIHAV